MKQAILSVLQLLLTAGGGALTSNGITTDGEAQTIAGALLTLVGVIWVIIERHRKAAAVAKAAADAAKIVAPCVLLVLGSNIFFATGGIFIAGCTLTSGQKETVANALIEVAKFGLKFGLHALAQKFPDLAPFVPNLEAKFQVTFADPHACATPESFADAIRRDVMLTVSDPDARSVVLDLLAGAIRDEAAKEATASAPAAPPRETQITYALQVADALNK